MKKLLTIFLTIISLTTMQAQTADEKAVAQAVEELRKAMIDANKQALENLSAPELSYGHSGGKVEDKAAFIEKITSGKSNFEAITLTDQTIRVVDNTAIVRHQLTADTNDAGKKPETIHLSVLLIWQKQQGQWKLLARQAVKAK